MTEEDARLALLQTELNAILNNIGRLDTVIFQIKGWCVTASLAIGGFAVANHQPGLLIVGVGAVAGFYLINCQFKTIQRVFIRRNKELDSELKTTGIIPVLKGAGKLDIVGTALPNFGGSGLSHPQKMRRGLLLLWSEARRPNTFSLYLLILVFLTIEAIILL